MTTSLAQESQHDWVGQRCCLPGKETGWCLCVVTCLSGACYSLAPGTTCVLLCSLQHITFSRRLLYVWRQHTVLHGNLCIFFFSDWHLEGSDKHFVSYCCRKQWLFVCHFSACFSLYLCTNPTDTSVFPRLLIIIHSCRFQQEKETNHVVRDACGGNGEKAKIWTAEVDPSGAIWKYSSRALGPNSDVSYKSKIQAQWHGASSPGAFDLSSLRWTDDILVPNSVFQTYGMAIATFCQTVVDSVAEIQGFFTAFSSRPLQCCSLTE